MTSKLGILPAAGKATRFKGFFKELLPSPDEGNTLLERSLRAMHYGGAEAVVLITNREKLPAHAAHLERWPVLYAVQMGVKDLWSAVSESLTIAGERNFFAMPDTFYPLDIFEDDTGADLQLNYFDTEAPERFAVITEHGVVDKMPWPPGVYRSWGTLVWSDRVAAYWRENFNEISSFTQALNLAMLHFGYELVKMPYYYDMASVTDYGNLLRARNQA